MEMCQCLRMKIWANWNIQEEKSDLQNLEKNSWVHFLKNKPCKLLEIYNKNEICGCDSILFPLDFENHVSNVVDLTKNNVLVTEQMLHFPMIQ